MKYFILIGLVVLLKLQNAICNPLPTLSVEEETCLTDLKLDKPTIYKIHLKMIKEEDNLVYNRYIECCYKKKGFMDEHGRVNFDVIKLRLNRNNKPDAETERALEEIVGDCKDIRGNDHGHTALLVQNCMSRHWIKVTS